MRAWSAIHATRASGRADDPSIQVWGRALRDVARDRLAAARAAFTRPILPGAACGPRSCHSGFGPRGRSVHSGLGPRCDRSIGFGAAKFGPRRAIVRPRCAWLTRPILPGGLGTTILPRRASGRADDLFHSGSRAATIRRGARSSGRGARGSRGRSFQAGSGTAILPLGLRAARTILPFGLGAARLGPRRAIVCRGSRGRRGRSCQSGFGPRSCHSGFGAARPRQSGVGPRESPRGPVSGCGPAIRAAARAGRSNRGRSNARARLFFGPPQPAAREPHHHRVRMLRLDLLERRQQLLLRRGAERGRLVAEDDRPVGVAWRHQASVSRLPAFEPLQFLDQRRPLQVQQARRLHLVPLRAFERPLDQRQLDALDVALEVDAFIGEPRRAVVRRRRAGSGCPDRDPARRSACGRG